jgi:dihydrolipoamide dehydrogenase
MACRHGQVSFDLAKVTERSRKVANQLNAGVKGLMKKHKVTVVEGSRHADGCQPGHGDDRRRPARARREEHHRRHRRAGARSARRAGRWPARLDLSPRDGAARNATQLLVIGSGAIGVEFASFYNDMGAEVTVVEMLDRILPVEDEDISAPSWTRRSPSRGCASCPDQGQRS